MTGYCNHDNMFKSSETEKEMLDKHMWFLIKNYLVWGDRDGAEDNLTPHLLQLC